MLKSNLIDVGILTIGNFNVSTLNMVTDPSTYDAALLSVHLEILVKGVIFLASTAIIGLLLAVWFFESRYFILRYIIYITIRYGFHYPFFIEIFCKHSFVIFSHYLQLFAFWRVWNIHDVLQLIYFDEANDKEINIYI